MRITVRLHTILRRETPEGIVDRVELNLPEGASVAQAVAQLAIARRPRTMLLVVNGNIVPEDRLLAEGDELRLVPGVSGGSCQLSATPALPGTARQGRCAPERSPGRLTAPVHRDGCAPQGRGLRPALGGLPPWGARRGVETGRDASV